MKKKLSLSMIAVLPLVALTAHLARAEAHKQKISAVWANDGGDKVVREDVRVRRDGAGSVTNSVWKDNRIHIFGARNEIVAFNVVLESADAQADNVTVAFNRLTGANHGMVIQSTPTGPNGVFDWTNRDIELFYVRYLKIQGLSAFSYESYNDPTGHYEMHIPARMRRPYDSTGHGRGEWKDRPDADKSYPEIAVPLELSPSFSIERGQNQSIWVDVYIPRFAAPDTYRGTFSVLENGRHTYDIPVELVVRDFSLPETPSSKTMLYLGYEDINKRYLGKSDPKPKTERARLSKLIRDRHFQLAHRHKISMIDKDQGPGTWNEDSPRYDWVPRLDGSLFSPQNGYEGPGAYVGNGIYGIGVYGSWSWKKDDDETSMHEHADAWVKWFKRYAPDTEKLLYLIDESSDYLEIEKWARWVKSDPGPGHELSTFVTMPDPLPNAIASVPDVDITANWLALGVRDDWEKAVSDLKAKPQKQVFAYNGKRPGSGSFATEDDGVALRELPWGQYKKGINRWFYWESTYYSDNQSSRGDNDLFNDAHTIGSFEKIDPLSGRSGYHYSNGDGVLFYPGTDTVYTADSYNLMGPIASLRLKHWRRGIQDVDYITAAAAIDPVRTQAIVARMVPKVLWENDVDTLADPTYVHADISWSTNPDDWEAARAELADIIEGK